MEFQHLNVAPFELAAPILDIVPVGNDRQCRWIALLDNGDITELTIHLDSSSKQTPTAQSSLLLNITAKLSQEATLALHVSRDERYCAIVERYGIKGIVYDMSSKAEVMSLIRRDVYVKFSSFPIAFVSHHERTLLVHGTDWMRLDVSDPFTGELLTARELPADERVWSNPRYLDYFHCSLLVSPDGKSIADNGWIWHPFGTVRTWGIAPWLDGNVWESEAGQSVKEFSTRNYVWDVGLCWIDNSRIAVWGKGQDGNDPRAAVVIYDVKSGEELKCIERPRIAPSRWQTNATGKWGWMVFDDFLLVVSYASGTGVWDIETGERLHHKKNFKPDRYHASAKQFLTLKEDGSMVVSYLIR